jgi:sulfite exporter TauE/SafE
MTLTDTQALRDRLSTRKRLAYVLAGAPLLAFGVTALANGGVRGGGFALAGALLVWCGLRNTSL